VILGFCHGVNEIYIVLGFYTAYIGTLLLTFWEKPIGPIFKGQAIQEEYQKHLG